MIKNKKGFTLLELLVVVLIIGILAAVALPQYKKSVQRTKAAQVDVILSTVMKAIDEYLYVQGGGSGTVYLTGTNSPSSIEIPGNCSSDVYCYTDVGRFFAWCNPGSCRIDLNFYVNADGTGGNKWLVSEGIDVFLTRESLEGPWKLEGIAPSGVISKNSSSAEGRRAAEIICPILERYIPPNDRLLQCYCL